MINGGLPESIVVIGDLLYMSKINKKQSAFVESAIISVSPNSSNNK